jgi:NAD(P)-dependent dehydrogenase (short-subunit alcohol dehydrogenase family)
MTIENKHIVIVGGTKGIGAATAKAALAAGARVTVTGRSQASLDAALAGPAKGASGELLDFTDAASVASSAARIGTPDHLVLSASSDVAWGPFTDLGEDAMRAAFEAKFWGYWRLMQALGVRLPEDGSLTLVTGAAARAALPGTAGLAAVNGALEATSKVLAVELAPRRVNVVSPGMTATEAYGWMPDEQREGMFAGTAASLPAGRIAQPEDIAQAVLFAAANPALTGATLDVNGGAHLAH